MARQTHAVMSSSFVGSAGDHLSEQIGFARDLGRRPMDRLGTALTRRRRGGRRLRLIRRAVAVALFLLAGALALAPAPTPQGADLVWTAARSLPVGAVLAARDVTGPARPALRRKIFASVTVTGRVMAAPVAAERSSPTSGWWAPTAPTQARAG